jgi:hypothetical protein
MLSGQEHTDIAIHPIALDKSTVRKSGAIEHVTPLSPHQIQRMLIVSDGSMSVQLKSSCKR